MMLLYYVLRFTKIQIFMCLPIIRIEWNIVLGKEKCPEENQTISLERGESPIPPVTSSCTDKLPACEYLFSSKSSFFWGQHPKTHQTEARGYPSQCILRWGDVLWATISSSKAREGVPDSALRPLAVLWLDGLSAFWQKKKRVTNNLLLVTLFSAERTRIVNQVQYPL